MLAISRTYLGLGLSKKACLTCRSLAIVVKSTITIKQDRMTVTRVDRRIAMLDLLARLAGLHKQTLLKLSGAQEAGKHDSYCRGYTSHLATAV